MQLNTARVGRNSVLVASHDAEIGEQPKLSGAGRKTIPTSIPKKLSDTFNDLKPLFAALATELGTCLDGVSPEARPEEVSVELGLSFSGGLDAWFVSLDGTGSVTVKMSWSSNHNE